jgi:diacylglycerol diphosphate phosphatase/phosphatidate phosphatase
MSSERSGLLPGRGEPPNVPGALVRWSVGDWIFVALIFQLGRWADTLPPFVHDIKPQLHDPTISYLHTPLTEQKVPVSLLWKLSVMLPLVILAPLAAFPARGVSRGEQLCALWLGLCTSIATSYVCVNIVKVAVGRPRPDFLARCMPTPEGVCTGVASVVAEGRKSFPSGHSAFSFAGLGYASIVLAAALAQRRTPAAGNLWKVLVVSLPWLLAMLVALSRVQDHWHHWQDVACGALIGNAAAIGAFRLRFPFTASLVPHWASAETGGKEHRSPPTLALAATEGKSLCSV